jgi:Xaa-Pro aminopeptidase
LDTEITQRLVAAMTHHELDGLVAFGQENVAYCAGYTVPSQALNLRDRQFAVAVNRDGDAAMLLTSNEVAEAETRSTLDRLRPYDEFADDPMAVLAGAIEELGLAGARVGFEFEALATRQWLKLERHIGATTWEDGTDAFKRARMVKTSREIDAIRGACRIADNAQRDAHDVVRSGMTEREVYRLLVERALAQGADDVVFVQVAAGDRSALSNPSPGDTKLCRGDAVKVDVFVSEGGYMSDTGRSFVVGDAPREYVETWGRMQDALLAVEDAVRPGATTRDLWDVFVNSFAQNAMEPIIRFLGHGLGLSLHEEPFIAAHTDTVLEAGMVFAIEPVYRLGRAGFHLEDNVLVTESGIENLTSVFGRDLIVVDRGS